MELRVYFEERSKKPTSRARISKDGKGQKNKACQRSGREETQHAIIGVPMRGTRQGVFL